MNVSARFFLIPAVGLLMAGTAMAQQSTEQYIPIGRSPGVSDVASYIGEITAVDYAAHTIQVRGRDDSRTMRMLAATHYYLDRSKYKRTNTPGNFDDCEIGRTVEARFNDDGTVDWIKIDVH